jgi:hypothetical protein
MRKVSIDIKQVLDCKLNFSQNLDISCFLVVSSRIIVKQKILGKVIFSQGENILSHGHEHDEQFSLTNLRFKKNR